MKILAIVEKGKDGLYSIYTEAEIAGHSFGGFGESVEFAKKDFMESIQEAKEMITTERGSTPEEFTDLKVEFKYDLESFFNYFDWINASKFAAYAGINESKMRQYKTGAAFAGEKTTNKILNAIKKLGAELSAASL
ncbi:pilus assembly protein HicB [Odoribacter splanchnicus]|uniref:pilus assembly protein HicB n=1 Tax=Odoribacter splanchnicus TaxID=28118 RepID=UPI00189C26EB|nr:pilus assembly protein HicB [Odoribacter splanchnicus]